MKQHSPFIPPQVEIWRIEDFEMSPLERSLYGQFFGGDSYVILYTYLVNNKENWIIYFWQGQVRGSREQQNFVDDGSGKVWAVLPFAPLGFGPVSKWLLGTCIFKC